MTVRLAMALGAALAMPLAFAADVVTVYAAGDIAECPHGAPFSGAAATAALVAEALARDPQAAVLTLGDHVYPNGSAADFASCYAPTWGAFKSRTYPSPGNRDVARSAGGAYFTYFGAAAGRGYYSFDLGRWHLVSLDSNLAGAAQAAQIDWLRADLAASATHCTLAYWHHPLYSSGGHGDVGHMRDAWQVLVDAGVELVLSGHDHDYERFAPQDANGQHDAARGVRQFVVGTGGAFITLFRWPWPNSEVRDNTRTGVLKLVLRPDAYDWQFMEARSDGFPGARAPDQGSAACH